MFCVWWDILCLLISLSDGCQEGYYFAGYYLIYRGTGISFSKGYIREYHSTIVAFMIDYSRLHLRRDMLLAGI